MAAESALVSGEFDHLLNEFFDYASRLQQTLTGEGEIGPERSIHLRMSFYDFQWYVLLPCIVVGELPFKLFIRGAYTCRLYKAGCKEWTLRGGLPTRAAADGRAWLAEAVAGVGAAAAAAGHCIAEKCLAKSSQLAQQQSSSSSRSAGVKKC